MNESWVRRAVNWIALPVGAVVVTLLLAEGMLRVANVSFPVFDTYDDARGVALRPGKEGWYRKEGNAYLRINSLGYRDNEHEVAKPAGTYRIAVLGDSFTEARQVALEDTFSTLLGRDLGSCAGLNGRKVEVLNFGVGSYGTAQELLTLRMDALRFSPDLVLLAFFPGNDFEDNSKELTLAEGWKIPKPVYVHVNGELVLDQTFRRSSGSRLLYESVHHSRVLEVVNEARRAWVVRKEVAAAAGQQPKPEPATAEGIYAPPESAAWREAWLVTEELLERMHQEVVSSGARFVVTTLSMPPQVYPDTAARQAIERRLGIEDLFYADRGIAELGRRYGYPVIDLAEPLQRMATEEGIYLHGFENSVMGEGHWNEAGHAHAAKILGEGICSALRPDSHPENAREEDSG
jgi:hypothetical protein